MDAILLSRIQFAVTTLFHILFPTLTIGLSVFLVVVEFLWIRTKEELYYRMYRYWVKFFAINFGVGVVTGIVLEFEFGTNFSRFTQAISNVMAPLMAFEVMTAFFLESGFLGIMLFGWSRVNRSMHFLATSLVSMGTILSSFWIIAANSWMQTPAGYRLIDGKFMVTDFHAAIFNPSTVVRMLHMSTAALETSAFVVAGVSAYYLLKGSYRALFRRSLMIALIMAALFAPVQMFIGDQSGGMVFHHQPAKLAAIEAHWEKNTEGGAPFAIVAFPDMKAERNAFEISIPNGLSLLATHTLHGQVPGLRDFPRENRPSVPVVFLTFRVMAGIGTLLLLVMVWGLFLWRQGRLSEYRPFLWTLLIVHPLGFLAVLTGWITTEAGRQPWLVYGLMRTAEGVSPIAPGNVIWSLSLFLVIFAAIGSVYSYYVLRTIGRGPDMSSPIPAVQLPAGMLPLQDHDRMANV
ncbi:MAG TPA: cytochrome ubiquinol oxidase subunit I [Nitrospirota bacterium]|nr:cytochrome ubiquinol oxidase subunit I [Nitrospirota bacterium]